MGKAYDAMRRAEADRERRQIAPGPGLDPVISPPPNGRRRSTMSFDLDPLVEEEYQKLRSNLFTRAGKDDLRTVMLVGSAHGDGVTTTSVILASVLARAGVGQVLLIDANLRTSALHDVFLVADSGRGVTDMLTNGVRVKDLVQPTSIPNLSVMLAGRPLKSPSYLYQDQGAITTLLDQLRPDFRYILIDSPPITDYSDSTFLAPKVDGIVIVIRAERTKIETALNTKRQLEWVGGHVIGTVLNRKKSYIPRLVQRLI